MADTKRVLITHADGREYTILPADFTNPRVSPDRRSYADRGFRIAAYADGTPYDGPKSKREIEKAAEQRQAARQERASEKTAPKAEAKGKA
jgi:hypothetical protein